MEVKPECKQTELGLVPKDWATSTLLEVAVCLDKVRVPLNETQRQRMRGDIPYCGANGVLDYVNNYVIDDDIILMAEDGGYFDEYATRPIAYRMTGKCWINNHAHVLKAKPGFDQGFLFYSLVHKNILPFLASGTRAKLNKSQMAKIVVPAPPTEAEQRAIATALSDVDALQGAMDRLIAKKRDLKQAAMQQLLTGKTRLPGFKGEWEEEALGQGIQLFSGHHVLAQYCNSSGVGFPYLTGPADFSSGRIRQTKFTERPTTICRKNDILITVKGSGAGNMVVADADYCISRQLMAVRVLAWDTRFIMSLLNDVSLIGAAATGLIPGLSRADILNMKLRIPPLTEQCAIATVLSDMDAEIAALKARRDKTLALKQGMMQELLTGRTRLV